MLLNIKKDVCGFTLIELLVVLAITATTITMGAIFIKNEQPRLRLYTAAALLRADLLKARQQTVALQIKHGVRFFGQTNSYQLIKQSNPAQILATSTLPTGVIFFSLPAFPNDTVNFNSAGGALQSGTIVLSNNSGQTKQVIISPSGYIRME